MLVSMEYILQRWVTCPNRLSSSFHAVTQVVSTLITVTFSIYIRMKTSNEFIEKELNDCRMKSLITVCFTLVLLLKFLRHVYVYFLAYEIIMLQLPGILFFPEQSWQPLNTREIQLAANMTQDLVITLSLFLIKELISQLIFTLYITLKSRVF